MTEEELEREIAAMREAKRSEAEVLKELQELRASNRVLTAARDENSNRIQELRDENYRLRDELQNFQEEVLDRERRTPKVEDAGLKMETPVADGGK